MYAYREPTAYEMDLSLWSDLHKDVYGIRPRGRNPSREELPAEFERLSALLTEVMAEERQAQRDRQKQLKHYVRLCMTMGMTGRAALEEAFRLSDADPMYGWEQFCFTRGIGYALDRYLTRHGVKTPGPAWGDH